MAVLESRRFRTWRGDSGSSIEERPEILSGDEQSGLLLRVERTPAAGAAADGAVHRSIAQRAEPAGFLRRNSAHAGRLSGGSGALPEGSRDQPTFQCVAGGRGFDLRFDGRPAEGARAIFG